MAAFVLPVYLIYLKLISNLVRYHTSIPKGYVVHNPFYFFKAKKNGTEIDKKLFYLNWIVKSGLSMVVRARGAEM